MMVYNEPLLKRLLACIYAKVHIALEFEWEIEKQEMLYASYIWREKV